MAQPHADITAVIFDMDGLLFDTERLAVEGWQQAGPKFGLTIPKELVLSTVGRNTEDTRAIFERALGKQIDFTGLRQIRMQYATDYIARNGVPVKDGAREILDVLTARKVRRAVATSTKRSPAGRLLKAAGIHHQFDVIVCGDEVARGKPYPDIFLHAAAQLNVNPEHCAVLEDSASGIRAAVNAGMVPFLVPDLVQPSAEMRALDVTVFADLREAASYIATLLPKIQQ